MKTFFKIALLVPLSLLWIWALVVEPYLMLDVDVERIFIPAWDAKLNGLKVAVLGDIHAARGPHEHYRLQKIVDTVNSQNPDIVLLTGDYVNGSLFSTSMDLDELSNFLRQIKAPKIAIFGNHDVYFGLEKVRNMLKKAGAKVLENSSAKVDAPNGSFYVAGIADPITSEYFYKQTLKDVPQGAPLIFLSHSPTIFRELPQGVDIMFSGHTHGGQVRLLIIRRIKTSTDPSRNSDLSGWIMRDGKVSYTTRGLGTSRLPIRFMCPPQISVFEIYKGDLKLNSDLR